MKHVFLPYEFGTDHPISSLFENLVPYFESDYKFTTLSNSESNPSCRTNFVSLRNKSKFFTGLKLLRESLKNYDIIHTGGFYRKHKYASKLSKMNNQNISHIHSFQVDLLADDSEEDRTRDLRIERNLTNSADVVTAVSEHTAETVRENFDIDPVVIYNAVDTNEFHPEHQSTELIQEINVSQPFFLYVGSLTKRKRPGDVIEVARHLPAADFIIVGDGPLYNELKMDSEQLDNVCLTGRVDKHKLPAIYSRATGFIFPSIREGCPNVVLESLSSETPVVGYNSTSMPEIVSHSEWGFLAQEKDVDELHKYAKKLIESNISSQLGKKGRIYVQDNHTYKHICSKYESIYSGTIS